ncbi:MAG: PulJ/GspJ family protein [Planctomycetota bacterium]|jgi:prepilin-type N-terminal cleavage/methylation domain-containing protein
MRTARAFTLIETVVAISIASVLLVGMGSTILIASKAMPDAESAQAEAVTAAIALERMDSDLRAMLRVIEHTDNAITFTVPDRDNDGAPERLRYAWDGTHGSPLTRQLNAGDEVALLPSVNRLNLVYETAIVSETLPGASLPIATETLLLETGAADHHHELPVSGQDAHGQILQPVLPPDALAWRPSRIAIYTKYNNTGSGAATFICRAQQIDSQFNLTGVDLVNTQIKHNSIDFNFVWMDVPFSTQPTLEPGDAIALLVDTTSNKRVFDLYTDRHAGSGRLSSNDGGATWRYHPNKSVRCQLYGTVSYPGTDWNLYHEDLTAVRVALRVSGRKEAYTHTAAPTLNRPAVLSGAWAADFSVDPTDLDLDADGVADWQVEGGDTISGGDIVDGVWTARDVIRTAPDNNFVQPLTVRASMRDIDTTTGGAALELYVDRSGTTHGLIGALVERQADGSQTLTVAYATDKVNRETVVTVTDLPEGFVDLRLIAEPDRDLFCVEVNGVSYGAFGYTRFDGFTTAAVLAGLQGSGGQFESLSIEVKE